LTIESLFRSLTLRVNAKNCPGEEKKAKLPRFHPSKTKHNPNYYYGEKTQYIIAYYLLNSKWMEKSSFLTSQFHFTGNIFCSGLID